MRITIGIAALLLAAPAFAADLQRCAAIDDDSARLACYDEVAGHKPVAASMTPIAPPAVPPAPTPASPDRFGAEQLRSTQAANAQEPTAMHARIVGNFEGWEPKTRFKLDNGQTWIVVDDRSAYFPATSNPDVTIEKGVFGSYYLSVDGRNSRVKVKRAQ